VTQTRPKLTADERRLRLLQVATRVFAEGSYRGTTTAEIARAFGCSEPILYRHFPSKRELYFACIEHAWAKLRERIDSSLETDDRAEAVERLRRDLDTLARGKAELSHLWAQGMTEALEDPEIRRFMRKHLKDVHAHLVRLIRHGQKVGILHPDRDPEVEAWVTIGSVAFGALSERLGGLMGDIGPRLREQRRAWMTPT
jgi:AcrR family transcriptional regulator